MRQDESKVIQYINLLYVKKSHFKYEDSINIFLSYFIYPLQ